MRRQRRKKSTDAKIMESMKEAKEQKLHVTKSKSGIIVKGIDDVAVRFSKCCNPVPGDEIVGFVTRGRGVTIHRTDCVNMLHLAESERERLIDAEWQGGATAPAVVRNIRRRSRSTATTVPAFWWIFPRLSLSEILT